MPTSSTGAQIAPGSYNHEVGEKATRPKSISAVIPRVKKPDNQTNQDPGPDAGFYNADKPFGSGLKGVPIGVRRPIRVEETPGPGTFDPEAAADRVRPKSPMTKLSKASARPKSIANAG